MFRHCGIFMAVFMVSLAAFGQDNRLDVTLGINGAFNHSVTGNNTTLTPTNSGGFLFTPRYRFSGHSSVEFTYTRTSNSQIYVSGPLTYRIHSNVSEYSGAYVFSFMQSERVEPFVLAGAAAINFNPTFTGDTINGVPASIPASRQIKPAFLYGAGFDYKLFSLLPLVRRSPLTAHLGLRLQYRGLLYKAPDFRVQNLFTGGRGHMAEPSAGIVFKF